MYRVGITGSLPISHSLQGSEEERRPHSHTYRIEWIYSAAKLTSEGFAVDIARMEAARDMVLKEVKSSYLNDLPFFSDKQPSVENFAVFLCGELEKAIAAGGPPGEAVEKVELRVWENDTAWASYEADRSLPAEAPETSSAAGSGKDRRGPAV